MARSFQSIEDEDELRLSPFSYPSSPKQLVKISMNGELLSEIELEGGGKLIRSIYRAHICEKASTESASCITTPLPLHR